MNVEIKISGDQLARMVAAVFHANGYKGVQGISTFGITAEGQEPQQFALTGVTVHCAEAGEIEVYENPEKIIGQLLNPYGLDPINYGSAAGGTPTGGAPPSAP